MAKINFTADNTGNLNHLDILLFKNRGWKAAWKRFRFFCKNDKYDDIALLVCWESQRHVVKVNKDGVLMYHWNEAQLKGSVRWMLEAASINLKTHAETDRRANASIGGHFSSTSHAIAHIFCFPDAHLADIESIIETHNYQKTFSKYV